MGQAGVVRKMKIKKDELQIIYEDLSTLVVNKPSGLLSVPDRYDPAKPDLYNMLQTDRPDANVMLVHRLDRGASGVMLFATEREAHRFYSGEFAKRRVGKVYLALVHGVPGEMSGTINRTLREHPSGRGRMAAAEPGGPGKDASTRYEVIERFGGYAFVRAVPREGYQHQVRVHLASAGMPVVADQHYGDGRPLFLSAFKRKYTPGSHRESPLIGRLALHATVCELPVIPTANHAFSSLVCPGISKSCCATFTGMERDGRLQEPGMQSKHFVRNWLAQPSWSRVRKLTGSSAWRKSD